MHVTKNILLATMLAAAATGAISAEMKQVNRYTHVLIKPSKDATDPLSQVVDIQFPPNILRVADAIRYVLEPTGYKLPEQSQYLDRALIKVGGQKLPISQRKVRGSICEVLRVLAGPGFVVVRDDVNRLVVLDYMGV